MSMGWKVKAALAGGAALLVLWAWRGLREGSGRGPALSVEAGFSKEIQPTPIQVRGMRRLRQWEFLRVEDEELVDTARPCWWGPDDRLARIYRGALRIGVDLGECGPEWAMAVGDTALVTLPPVRLLDSAFVDEARAVSFHQSGKWDAAAYDSLRRRAERAMLRRAMTKENTARAEQNARAQAESLFRSLGYASVRVTVLKAAPSVARP